MSTAVETNPNPGKNKYVVWNSVTSTFDEYPIKLSDVPVGNFIEFIVAPPVRREGFLTFKKQVYKVPLHNLIRNKVNVSTPYVGTNPTNTGSPTTVGNAVAAINSNQQAAMPSIGDDVDKESSVYWAEQIESLFYSEDSEA